jgi:hypothetical protein
MVGSRVAVVEVAAQELQLGEQAVQAAVEA